jgi:exopolysaccharide production negative regulator
MRTYRNDCQTRWAGRLLLALALLGGTAASTISPGSAQEIDGFGSQFYSFVPAKPESELPKLGDVSLWRDDMKMAKQFYAEGDYVRAREHLEKASKAGSLIATWYLGDMYRTGKGVTVDTGKSFAYYRQVALAYDSEQPNRRLMRITVDALVRVADIYRDGAPNDSIHKDPVRAYNLYSTAAGHGHPAAIYAIGVMYLKGQGVKKMPDQGIRWLMRAARKRYAPAEAMLGDLHYDGIHVKQDKAKAVMWYTLARQTARPDAYPQIISRFGTLLDEVSDEERTSGEALAVQWSEQYPAEEPPSADE